MNPIPTRSQRERRGAALLLVLLLLLALGAFATASIALSANSGLLAKAAGREQDLRYAAEAGLAMAKSRLNFDPTALPDSGVVQLLANQPLTDAAGTLVPGVKLDLYAGPSGSTSGQEGRFASVVSVARDAAGNTVVRRLELAQESFAKFAYWSNRETNNGQPIYFGNNDQLWGPVWSNDVIRISDTRATFNDDVGTAQTIQGVGYGTFRKGYRTNQQPIRLPSTDVLRKLAGYASVGGYSFTAPNNGSETAVMMRIEFVRDNLNPLEDADSTDADEGFFRVFVANAGSQALLRGDWVGTSTPFSQVVNCGDWHEVPGHPDPKFFPVSVHDEAWFRALLVNPAPNGMGLSGSQVDNHRNSVNNIMRSPGARCYPIGDPHLVAVERRAADYPQAWMRQKGGDDTTFTPVGNHGSWRLFSNAPNARILAARPHDARYIAPLHRSLNPGVKGVIHVNGTVAVSGEVRGRVTVYVENGTAVILDDLRYGTDPGRGVCQDILGLISDRDIVVADNAINEPRAFGSQYRSLDETKDLYIHGVMMALRTSFRVQNYDSGPDDATDCEGVRNGRGCLYLTGGLIQEARGAVALLSGTGYIKRYAYDRCAVINPPPYFPTTGRFDDNRYYEIDPVGFDAVTLFRRITPDP